MAKDDAVKTEEELSEGQDTVIQEQIKPWHKRKFKKVLSVVGFSLLAGIIFGISGRFVFKYSDGFISKIFGLNQTYDGATPRTTNINQTKTSESGDNHEIKIIQTDAGAKENNPQGNSPVSEGNVSEESFRQFLSGMRNTASNVQKGMIRIDAITNVVNWLGETVEQNESTMGIIVAESEEFVFILSYHDKVKNADKLEIVFESGNSYIVSILAYDESYNIAVLTVAKQVLKQDDIDSIAIMTIGNSEEIYAGMPIIGLGSFDGSSKMIEYGYITSDDFTEYITDAAIEMFTTDLSLNENSVGIIVDLEGRLIGIITRQVGSSIKFTISKAMKVNSLVKVAEILCNGGSRMYLGLKTEDIPDRALRENNIDNGIYVSSVEPSSPASDAGIRKGDFILSLNGIPINDVSLFTNILMQAEENGSLEIELYRASKSADQKFKVTVKPIKKHN